MNFSALENELLAILLLSEGPELRFSVLETLTRAFDAPCAALEAFEDADDAVSAAYVVDTAAGRRERAIVCLDLERWREPGLCDEGKVVGTPLRDGAEVRGVLRLGPRGHAFARRDVRRLERISNLLTPVLWTPGGDPHTSRARLRHLLDERTRRLEAKNDELRRFASVAAHDLKGPLRNIGTIASWLHEDIEDLTPEVAEHLRLLREQTKRLQRFVDDYLAYARADVFEDDPQQTCVEALVHEVVGLLSLEDGFTVATHDLPCFEAHRIPLKQVLLNLISNAVKHHPRPHSGRVQVACVQRTASSFVFEVRDDGEGIPESLRGQLFEAFVAKQRQQRSDSTGLGLALVRKLVERAGGRIWLEEAVDGTAFRFRWPAEPD